MRASESHAQFTVTVGHLIRLLRTVDTYAYMEHVDRRIEQVSRYLGPFVPPVSPLVSHYQYLLSLFSISLWRADLCPMTLPFSFPVPNPGKFVHSEIKTIFPLDIGRKKVLDPSQRCMAKCIRLQS